MPDVDYTFSAPTQPEGRPDWERRFLSDFRAAITDQYYQVDITTDAPNEEELRITAAKLGSLDIVRFQAPGTARSVRTRQHIRSDHSSVFVFWFVAKGELKISQYGKDTTLTRDCFGLINAGDPFRSSSYPDQSGMHESYGVLVPRHMVDARLRDPTAFCCIEFALNPLSRLASNIFVSLFNESHGVERELVSGLTSEAMRIIIAAVVQTQADDSRLQTKDHLLPLVKNCIDRRLGQPGLTARDVAKACGISERQIYRTFERQDLSFHSYLETSRLLKAREMLLDFSLDYLHISEIAKLVGYKSGAHFCRSYRKAFSTSPRSDRSRSRSGPLPC